MFSPDGRFTREGAETAYAVLKAFDPDVRNANIDVAASYTDAFVEKAPTGGR
jgi:NitT/TauT family transport system substrate-binding protein